MRNNIERILIVFSVLIPLLGCSNLTSTRMEETFKTVVPIADMNKSLEIKIDEDKEIFASSSDISIRVENKSSHFLFFDYEGNYIKLFSPKNGEWVEVQNGLTYSGSRVLSPKGPPLLNLDGTWARPKPVAELFRDTKKYILVRIVMTGEIMENDVRTGELVGAYVDVYVSQLESIGSPK